MSLLQTGLRRLLSRMLNLPARHPGRLQVCHDCVIAVRDGTALLANRYCLQGCERAPVILIRSPYGRGSFFELMASLLAERGFHVVLQSVRGTGGSEGELNPMRQEQDDGVDTVAWIEAQAWFGGTLFAFGGSYLGNAVWAMAAAVPEKIAGACLAVTLSNFRRELQGGDGVSLAGPLAWTQTELYQSTQTHAVSTTTRPNPKRLEAAHHHLPLGTVDQAAFGQRVPWWQAWLSHEDPTDPWWTPIDHSLAATTWQAPVAMVAGWQDIFLPFQVEDFVRRQCAGQPAWLTIGPWSHIDLRATAESLRQSLQLFSSLSQLSDKPLPDRKAVRVYLQGAGLKASQRWLEFDTWPPSKAQQVQWFLHPDGVLGLEQPGQSNGHSCYRYDPNEPTPSLHGPKVGPSARIKDMSALEARPDTLTFTTNRFERNRTVIGPVCASLRVRASRDYFDLYVVLTDVDRRGRSLFVCDGYIRVRPDTLNKDEAGVACVEVACWPTAYHFQRGHRLRLVVASGAFPRYARNPGTGESALTATQLQSTDIELLHNAEQVSALTLFECEE